MVGNLRNTDTSSHLLNALLVHGLNGLTQAQLADEAQVSARAASGHIQDLRARGIVQREEAGLAFGPGAGLVAAVSIGGGVTRTAIVDANGRVSHLETELAPTQLSDPPASVLARAGAQLNRTITKAERDPLLRVKRGRLPLRGVAFTVPSAIGRDGYLRGHSLTNREWRATPVLTQLRGALPQGYDSRADVLNNANADAVGIAFDMARSRALSEESPDEHSHVVIAVRISHGVGAGTYQLAKYERHGSFALAPSRLVVGSNGFAGELGHLPLTPSDPRDMNADLLPGLRRLEGVKCSCMQQDHLESFVSLRAIAERVAGRGEAYLLARPDLSQVLDAPDELLRRALSDAGRLVARSLGGTVLMLDPHRITLTGVLGVEALREGIVREQHAWAEGVPTSVKISTLTLAQRELITLRGAAVAMFRRQLYKPKGLSALAQGRDDPGA